MIIKKLHDLTEVENFLKHCFSSPTHWPDWNNVVSKHYSLDFYYLAAYENNRIIGICPVFETKKKLVSVMTTGQVMYIPYGGWIFNKVTSLNIEETPVRMNQTFSGFTLPLIPEFQVKYPLPDNPPFLTLLINLNMTYDKIFAEQFEHRVRKAIRKALNNNVKLEINSDFKSFYSYYEDSCSKKQLYKQSFSFFVDLFNNSNNIKFDILWAKIEDNPIGYLVIVYDKNYSIGFLSYMFPEQPKVGQGDFLIAEAVKLSQKMGCKYFDLCYIEKERLPTIYEFKKGFSSHEVPIIHFSKKPLTYRVINRLSK